MIDSGRAALIAQPDDSDDPRGASLLIAEDGRFLMAARPPVVTHDRVLVTLTGVGGWVESGETNADAVRREAVEETGCDVELFDLHQTLIVHSPRRIDSVCLMNEVGPAAVVYCRIGTSPFDPWSEIYDASVRVAVYTGKLDGPPRVIDYNEHPFFLWLYPEQLISLCDAELPLDYLLADGAELSGELASDHEKTLVRLSDSIWSLLTALGTDAFSFLGDIARLTRPARVE